MNLNESTEVKAWKILTNLYHQIIIPNEQLEKNISEMEKKLGPF